MPASNVRDFFKNVPGISDVALADVTLIDEHKDLTLVQFHYHTVVEIYKVRVTKMDSKYIEGFDCHTGIWSQFKRELIDGPVQLVELPIKQ